MLALLLPVPKGLDQEVLIKMAILHDLGECIIGDIVCEGEEENKKKQKDQAESQAIQALLGNKPQLEKIALDYIHQRTPEALYLKELDKLDMVLQAFFYEKNRKNPSLQEFWDSARKHIQNPDVLEIFCELDRKR